MTERDAQALDWTVVSRDPISNILIERASVDGGWLYMSSTYATEAGRDACTWERTLATSTSLAFVPSPPAVFPPPLLDLFVMGRALDGAR